MNKDLSIDKYGEFSLSVMETIDQALQAEICLSERKLIVLDDDPTGIQTVFGVSVYTDWDLESIRSGFLEDEKTFFILTNSRACSEPEALKIYRTIGERVLEVSRETGIGFLIICRGDSTLRGHFPLETEVIREVMKEHGIDVDGEILCPFFDDGGRYTIDDVHYVRDGEALVPVGKTEFASDRTFHFSSSNLKEYIEEKTGGRYKAEDVMGISLAETRAVDFAGIENKMMTLEKFGKMVVNAVNLYDVKVFCVALYRALRAGKVFLFRTAAPFINGISGIPKAPLLEAKDFGEGREKRGGIIVVGSHTAKTTRQLEMLDGLNGIIPVEMNSDLVLTDGLEEEVRRIAEDCSRLIGQGMTPVVYTKRKLLDVPSADREQSLSWAVKISDGVQKTVADLTVEPGFVIAKGGITSSDIGTKALKVKRAYVMGQIEPGVPVWRLGHESRFPDIPYVIFPGNVGDEMSLRRAVHKLLQTADL